MQRHPRRRGRPQHPHPQPGDPPTARQGHRTRPPTHRPTPRPLVLEDGTILVIDAGVLRAVDRRLNTSVLAELLPVDPDQAWTYTATLHRDGDHITARIAEPHPRHEDQYNVHTWTIALHQSP